MFKVPRNSCTTQQRLCRYGGGMSEHAWSQPVHGGDFSGRPLIIKEQKWLGVETALHHVMFMSGPCVSHACLKYLGHTTATSALCHHDHPHKESEASDTAAVKLLTWHQTGANTDIDVHSLQWKPALERICHINISLRTTLNSSSKHHSRHTMRAKSQTDTRTHLSSVLSSLWADTKPS